MKAKTTISTPSRKIAQENRSPETGYDSVNWFGAIGAVRRNSSVLR